MKIVALVEVHPLSGEPSFISARMSSPLGEFDMLLTAEQAELVLQHSLPLSEENQTSKTDFSLEEDIDNDDMEDFEYTHSKIRIPGEKEPSVIQRTPQPFFQTNEVEYDDDEL